MMTIDELIQEGQTFEIMIENSYYTLENGVMVCHDTTEYIEDGDRYIAWLEKTKRFIAASYPDDRAIDDFEEASITFSKKSLYRLLAILNALKECPAKCKRKNTSEIPATSISVVQSQNQSQSQNQQQSIDVVLKAIRDELTGRQYEELISIVKECASKEEAKPKIIEKLKNFGEGVLSGVLTNIITYPEIWAMLLSK